MMACPDTSPGVESAIVAAMGKVATYTASKTNLTMFDSSGATVLQYGAAPADALAGTSWNVTGINNGNQAVVSPATGTTVTLVFGTDGTVSGSGGCNTYNGNVAVDGDAISFGPLVSTQMACPQPVMDQETQFFAALAASSDVQRQRVHADDARQRRRDAGDGREAVGDQEGAAGSRDRAGRDGPEVRFPSDRRTRLVTLGRCGRRPA